MHVWARVEEARREGAKRAKLDGGLDGQCVYRLSQRDRLRETSSRWRSLETIASLLKSAKRGKLPGSVGIRRALAGARLTASGIAKNVRRDSDRRVASRLEQKAMFSKTGMYT